MKCAALFFLGELWITVKGKQVNAPILIVSAGIVRTEEIQV